VKVEGSYTERPQNGNQELAQTIKTFNVWSLAARFKLKPIN